MNEESFCKKASAKKRKDEITMLKFNHAENKTAIDDLLAGKEDAADA